MKDMLNLRDYLADDTTVGEWDGQEELAAQQVNRIYQALYDAAPDDIEPDELAGILSREDNRIFIPVDEIRGGV